jgi:hypothetical protein
MANGPAVSQHPGPGPQRKDPTVDSTKFSAPPPTITDPNTLAGDGIAYVGSKLEDDQDEHACYRGVVYLGQLVIGDDGEEEEVFFPVLCRRCAAGEERQV